MPLNITVQFHISFGCYIVHSRFYALFIPSNMIMCLPWGIAILFCELIGKILYMMHGIRTI